MKPTTIASLIVALVLIGPITLADSPDPSWLAGIYDGDDGDDIPSLVCGDVGIEPASVRLVPPLRRLSKSSPGPGSRIVQDFTSRAFSRGPPVRFLSHLRLLQCPATCTASILPASVDLVPDWIAATVPTSYQIVSLDDPRSLAGQQKGGLNELAANRCLIRKPRQL